MKHNPEPEIVIYQGDVRDGLRSLADESVQCVVTSPPYWALRDYGVEGQIGLEPTVQEYVANMVDVFREVRRVLRKDGTFFVNIGDTYAASGKDRTPDQACAKSGLSGSLDNQYASLKQQSRLGIGFKPKDRIGVPHRLAFAMQDDGWWFRDEIIWHKPAPMPESTRDRTTKAHEFIFMFSKSPRYYYDMTVASESAIGATPGNKTHKGAEAYANGDEKHRTKVGLTSMSAVELRQPRSVWKIATQPLKLAHFAAYPPELVRRCLIAGMSEKGCCPTCGAPWGRLTEKQRVATRPGENTKTPGRNSRFFQDRDVNHGDEYKADRYALEVGNRDAQRHVTTTVTTGWVPTCKCPSHEPIPCTVLDPFHGAGTTACVAKRMGFNYVGCELNPEYVAMSIERLATPIVFPHEKRKPTKRVKKHPRQGSLFNV